MNKYDDREATLLRLTKGKKDECVVALKSVFDYAVSVKGLSFRQAVYYAEADHFLTDHDGYNNLPDYEIGDGTYEGAIADLQEDIDSGEWTDGQPQYLLRWFKDVYSWREDMPVPLAISIALQAAHEQYDDDHDISDEEVIRQISEIPSDEMQQSVQKEFDQLKAEGNSNATSLREARGTVAEQLERALFQAVFGNALDAILNFPDPDPDDNSN